MSARGIDEFSGLRRELEIGLLFAPTRTSAPAVAKAIAAHLDADQHVAVRLAGLSSDRTRVHLILAVTLGTVDEIKTADPTARAALALIARLVSAFSACDAALATLPHPASSEARLAAWATGQAAHTAGGMTAAVGAYCTAA